MFCKLGPKLISIFYFRIFLDGFIIRFNNNNFYNAADKSPFMKHREIQQRYEWSYKQLQWMVHTIQLKVEGLELGITARYQGNNIIIKYFSVFAKSVNAGLKNDNMITSHFSIDIL